MGTRNFKHKAETYGDKKCSFDGQQSHDRVPKIMFLTEQNCWTYIPDIKASNRSEFQESVGVWTLKLLWW